MTVTFLPQHLQSILFVCFTKCHQIFQARAWHHWFHHQEDI